VIRPRFIRVAALAVAVVCLSACRVDTKVALKVNPNGSGNVTVTATVDSDIVAKQPNIKADLRTADLTKAGWVITGPTSTKDGGLTVSATHKFRNPTEATHLLSTIDGSRGPLVNVQLQRTGKDSNSTWNLTGTLEVNGGLAAFADDNTLTVLGTNPYAQQVAASGLDLGKALGVQFTAQLPGKVLKTSGQVSGNTITWQIPTDGTPTEIATSTNNLDIASNVARVAKYLVVILLIVWVIGSLVLLAAVANARRRRTPRY
jgi:hypothetical protein